MTIPGLKRLVPGIIYINWFHFLNCTYTEYCESTDMAIPSMAASTCTCTCTCAYMYMCISSDFYLSYLVCRWLWLRVCSTRHQVREGVCSEGTKLLLYDILLLAIVWVCGWVCIYTVHECNWVYEHMFMSCICVHVCGALCFPHPCVSSLVGTLFLLLPFFLSILYVFTIYHS